MLAAIVALAVGSGALLRSTRGDGAAVDRSSGATDAVTPMPSAPFLTVILERDDGLAAQLAPPPQGTVIVVRVTVRGVIPQLSLPGGQVPESGPDNLLGLEMNWGDGSLNQANRGEYSCPAGARLVEVSSEFVITHAYARPGTYTATYQTGACDPVGRVVQRIGLTVG